MNVSNKHVKRRRPLVQVKGQSDLLDAAAASPLDVSFFYNTVTVPPNGAQAQQQLNIRAHWNTKCRSAGETHAVDSRWTFIPSHLLIASLIDSVFKQDTDDWLFHFFVVFFLSFNPRTFNPPWFFSDDLLTVTFKEAYIRSFDHRRAYGSPEGAFLGCAARNLVYKKKKGKRRRAAPRTESRPRKVIKVTRHVTSGEGDSLGPAAKFPSVSTALIFNLSSRSASTWL